MELIIESYIVCGICLGNRAVLGESFNTLKDPKDRTGPRESFHNYLINNILLTP